MNPFHAEHSTTFHNSETGLLDLPSADAIPDYSALGHYHKQGEVVM